MTTYRVIHCKSAYEIWSHLVVTHEGTSQVKRTKIDLLRSQYENFIIHENDSIDDMITRFTKITNYLGSLGDTIDNDQKVRKVIRALPPSWEVKATTLKELNDKKEREFIGLIGNLKTHEMERKAREEMAPKKKDNCLQVHFHHLRWRWRRRRRWRPLPPCEECEEDVQQSQI